MRVHIVLIVMVDYLNKSNPVIDWQNNSTPSEVASRGTKKNGLQESAK